MKMMVMLAGAGVLALCAGGCAPKLDQTNLSPEEQAWAGYIKQNYSAWQAPQSVPRGVRRTDVPDNAGMVPAAEAPMVEEAVVVDETTGAAPAVDMTAVAVEAEAAPISGDVPPAAVDITVVAPDAAAVGTGAEEIYTVVQGDTLGGIALKTYGRASDWKKIQDANADVLKGKTVIRPGMKLKLPRP